MPTARVNDIMLNHKLEGHGEKTIVFINGCTMCGAGADGNDDGRGAPVSRNPMGQLETGLPQYRTILALDIERSASGCVFLRGVSFPGVSVMRRG
jgi:hypothetical protein